VSGRFLRQILGLVVMAAALVCRGDADEGVLWWCVGETATIGEKSLSDAGVESARIRVSGGGLGDDVFLNMYVDGGNGYEIYDGAIYADVPVSSPYYAALGEYGSTDYSFSIELGAWSGDDTFNVLGVSETWSYADLSSYLSSSSSVFAPGSIPVSVLTPQSFAVPEPSSGLLVLLGGMLLALRRRRS